MKVRPSIRVQPSVKRKRQAKQKNKVLKPAARPRPMFLTDRDVAFLLALHENRFLSTEQAQRHIFHECKPDTVRRRLRLLFDHRLVQRVALLAQPTRSIPPFVYILAENGATALADFGHHVQAGQLNPHRLQKFRHQFLCNDVRIRFAATCRGKPYSITDWRHENRLLVTNDSGNKRPQVITHPYLDRARPFLPDAYFRLGRLAGQEDLDFFVEVDLASHRLKVWKLRARLYAAYATGFFRERFGRQPFRLLIVTTPDFRGRSRLRNILTTVQDELRSLQLENQTHLFLATTLSDLGIGPDAKASAGMLGTIWRAPADPDRRINLLPNNGFQASSTNDIRRATVKTAFSSN